MPTLEHFCTITAEMPPVVLGKMPDGFRVDFPFEGTATGPHWDGEIPVVGTDHGRVRRDGSVVLDITARMGSGADVVFYKANGIALPGDSPSDAFPQELVTFETGSETLGFLNQAIGVAFGEAKGPSLSLEVYLARA